MKARFVVLAGALVALGGSQIPSQGANAAPTGVVTATGSAPSSEVIAKADCAFRRVRPCPVSRTRQFNLYGPYLEVNGRKALFDLQIQDFSGVPERATLKKLRRRRGASLRVVVTKRTRIFIVRPDHSRGRATRRAFFRALNNYERAPVYVSGSLLKKSYWDDPVGRLRASLLTLDLSDGAIANLAGEWRLAGDPTVRVILTAASGGLRRYDGELRTLAGERVATMKVTQPTTGTVCVLDWITTKGTGVPEHYDCGVISGNGQTLGPMAPRTPGRSPVTLTRSVG